MFTFAKWYKTDGNVKKYWTNEKSEDHQSYKKFILMGTLTSITTLMVIHSLVIETPHAKKQK